MNESELKKEGVKLRFKIKKDADIIVGYYKLKKELLN